MKLDKSLFIDKFSAEVQEHLQKLNEGVLALEQGQITEENMNQIMRSAHTLKGSARMLGFVGINQLAHKMEDLLLEIKEGRLKAASGVCDVLFLTLDQIEAQRQAIVEGGEEEIDVAPTLDLLARATRGEDVSASLPTKAPPAPPPPEAAEAPAPQAAPTPPSPPPSKPAAKPGRVASEEYIRVGTARLDRNARLAGEVVAAQKRIEVRLERARDMRLIAKEHYRRLTRKLQEMEPIDPEWAELTDEGRELLDGLNLLFKDGRDDAFTLERVATELQQGAMKLRMLPVSTVFDTFPRAVRDLARSAGKKVELVIEGRETELDKGILEKINDPIMHMVRNAVDHGIESSEERVQAGKSRQGNVWLRAYPMGGSVVIEVEDDGGGLPLEAIRDKALRKGLLSEEDLRTVSKRELIEFIFMPGFSTSKLITDVSGRGIGMDVVKRNIMDDLKGTVDVDSEEGKGTRFTITLPLTLTTLRVLTVQVNGQTFGLPLNFLAETVRIPRHKVIMVVDREAIRLREQLVPIADLAAVLNLPNAASPDHDLLFLVIARASGEQIGLVVEEVIAEEDVLIKALPKPLNAIKTMAGATITPEGGIIPIIHVPGLMGVIRELPGFRPEPRVMAVEAPRLLVVDDSLNTREIERSILEASGYEVDLAKDGLEALQCVEQNDYHLIVTDIEMPRMDGFTLTERLRADERYAHVPIVIVTSREKEADMHRGMAVGADAYIVKGTFDQNNLLATVESLIGRAAPKK